MNAEPLTEMMLTDAERDLIFSRRKAEEEEAQRRAAIRTYLRLAADYQQWLDTHSRGSSFSTYVNEFGGEARYFERVEAVRRAADGC